MYVVVIHIEILSWKIKKPIGVMFQLQWYTNKTKINIKKTICTQKIIATKASYFPIVTLFCFHDGIPVYN